jgi:hypothetical protein
MNRSGAFIALSTVSAVIAAGHAVVIKDNFSSNTLGTRWNVVDFTGPQAATTVAGGKLQVSGPGGVGDAYYALERQDCGFAEGSWKVSIAVKQVVEPSAIGTGDTITTCIGLQWGAFESPFTPPGNINGYFIDGILSNTGTTAVYLSWEEGAPQYATFGSTTNARKFSGNITATFTANKDRLVVQVGKYKRTFNAFAANIPFDGGPEIVISGHMPDSVSGLACTYDNFSASGPGIIPVN